MNFFSLEFALLFFGFLAIYWNLKNHTLQNAFILFFNYGLLLTLGNLYLTLVLLCYTIAIHFCALYITHSQKRFALLAAIALALLNLCFFKYYPSIKEFFGGLLGAFGFSTSQVEILMPLGISFYTFSSITYLRWVYEGRQANSVFNPNLQSFESLATYLSFFPTFVAGPIMRADFFFEQFNQKRHWQNQNVNLIFTLALFGITKKILLANYLGIYVAKILDDPSSFDATTLLLGIYGYSAQIYFDFSGYVNLVCAFALMMGFRLPPNFNMPYTAKNLKDFWARWHISLSTFIRDFIYIPLGGNKKGFFLTQIFVLIAFTLSGLWHGNTLNFLIWGALHGVGIIILNLLARFHISLQRIPLLSKLITFNFVTFCWVFFYYPEFSQSLDFLSALLTPPQSAQILPLLAVLGIFVLYQLCAPLQGICVLGLARTPTLLKPLVLALVLLVIFATMPNGIPNFIYAGF